MIAIGSAGGRKIKAERIAIVGSRSHTRPEVIEAFIAALPADTVVVSGGATGVDTVAETAARARGLEVLVFQADWGGLGAKAGPIRNLQIVAHADRVIAFWNGRSRGTLNTVVRAHRAGKCVEVFDQEGRPVVIENVLRAAGKCGVLAAMAAAESKQR